MSILKFAQFATIEARVAPSRITRTAMLRDARRHEFSYTPKPGFLYVRSRAISSRTNDNFDTYPADELRQAYRSFVGKPVFVNHNNEDPSRGRGIILDAVLHEHTAPDGSPDTWVEVLMEVDAVRFPRLAKAILDGDIDRTSMGCNVMSSECSYCGKVASTPDQYCEHINNQKGRRLRRRAATGGVESVLVHEVCRGLSFFENSLLVDEPADPTAFFTGVDDSAMRMARVAAFKPKETKVAKTALGSEWDYGPTEPGPNAGVRWEGVATEGQGYRVIVLWREYADAMAAMLSGVFKDPERAEEWAQKCRDLGAVIVEIRPPMARYDPVVAAKTAMPDAQGMTPEEIDSMWNAQYWKGQADAARQVEEGRKRLYAWKGQEVTVVKGRKIPKGTTGIVFYSGEGQWGWRIGFRTADGQELWTNLQNVELTSELSSIAAKKAAVGDLFIEQSGWGFEVYEQDDEVMSTLLGRVEAWGDVDRPTYTYHSDTNPRRTFDIPAATARDQAALIAYLKARRDRLAKKADYDEVHRAHPIETLRNQTCPVCKTQNTWDGNICTVCGYVLPPKPFRAPDTDVTGRVDPDEGWFDPDAKKADPFDPVPDRDTAMKGQKDQGDLTMAQSIAAAARQRLQAQQLMAQQRRAGLMPRRAADDGTGTVTDDVVPPAEAPAVTTEEALTLPDAQAVEPTTPGGTGVEGTAPDATVDVSDVGGVVPDSPPLDVINVEAPVAGATDVDAEAASDERPNINNAAEGADDAPLNASDWNTASRRAARSEMENIRTAVRDRIFSALRLSKLRIAVGVAEHGDELALAREIEDGRLSNESIANEIKALGLVYSRQRQAQTMPTAPHRRSARRSPSMAGGSTPLQSLGSGGSQDDEALFEP